MKLRALEDITVEHLQELAEPRSWVRGESYYNDDAVVELLQYERTLVATVEGTENYEVQLFLRPGGTIGWECSCPWSTDTGEFCKHCVAVGLAFVRGREEGSEWGDPSGPLRAVEKWLANQSKEALLKLVMELALECEPLRTELLHRAGQPSRYDDEDDSL
jgi:uncharacterized Zn finger protein